MSYTLTAPDFASVFNLIGTLPAELKAPCGKTVRGILNALEHAKHAADAIAAATARVAERRSHGFPPIDQQKVDEAIAKHKRLLDPIDCCR